MSGDKSPSAFPWSSREMIGETGMTLRDYFAGQALAGWLASFGPDDAVKPAGCAEFAYEVADAMLEARKQ